MEKVYSHVSVLQLSSTAFTNTEKNISEIVETRPKCLLEIF